MHLACNPQWAPRSQRVMGRCVVNYRPHNPRGNEPTDLEEKEAKALGSGKVTTQTIRATAAENTSALEKDTALLCARVTSENVRDAQCN